ncbi:hypothetical protein V500_08136 [Pseudogymnoascus sp. VKM F-4518 (FW-2643)]|nr:hypothetical protein V500_08136 [Pseudogymnoascus sp. VKM F-4518 (FW-2643)]
MYFLASLDRGDIGNAAVAGMNKDLKITPQQYSNCVSLFYLGYIVFELPGTIFLRKISPPIQLGVAMMGWGTCTTLMSIAQSWGLIAAMRVLIGCFEAFIQTGPLYLTFMVPEVGHHGDGYSLLKRPAREKRLYFLLRDCSCWDDEWSHCVWDRNESQWCPSPQEKAIAVRRTKEAFNVPHAMIDIAQLKAVLKDPKMYFYVVTYSCLNVSLASFGAFLPVLLRSFGYSALKTQLYTIPIYVVVAASILAIGFLAGSLAFIMVVGQSMALAGTQVYSDPPHYYRGSGFALGAMISGLLATVLLMIFLTRKNAAKVAAKDSDEAILRRGLSLEEIWDDHPDFYYYL